VNGGADRWIRWTTTGCVGLLALIAATVSYLHMHLLVVSHGGADVGQDIITAIVGPAHIERHIYAAGLEDC